MFLVNWIYLFTTNEYTLNVANTLSFAGVGPQTFCGIGLVVDKHGKNNWVMHRLCMLTGTTCLHAEPHTAWLTGLLLTDVLLDHMHCRFLHKLNSRSLDQFKNKQKKDISEGVVIIIWNVEMLE